MKQKEKYWAGQWAEPEKISKHGKLLLEMLNNPETLTYYVGAGDGAGATFLAIDVYRELLAPLGW